MRAPTRQDADEAPPRASAVTIARDSMSVEARFSPRAPGGRPVRDERRRAKDTRRRRPCLRCRRAHPRAPCRMRRSLKSRPSVSLTVRCCRGGRSARLAPRRPSDRPCVAQDGGSAGRQIEVDALDESRARDGMDVVGACTRVAHRHRTRTVTRCREGDPRSGTRGWRWRRETDLAARAEIDACPRDDRHPARHR